MAIKKFYNIASSNRSLQCYGVTYDESAQNYMLVLGLAECSLRQYLCKQSTDVTWRYKVSMLETIVSNHMIPALFTPICIQEIFYFFVTAILLRLKSPNFIFKFIK